MQANKNWQYEGVVMAFDLPVGHAACPVGTDSLYRMYNAGQGARRTTAISPMHP